MTLTPERLRDAPASAITLDDALAGLASGPAGFEAEVEAQRWREFAECQYTDPELFFPVTGGTNHQAKAICAGCGVRLECLWYALSHREMYGFWGGMSQQDRRELLGAAEDIPDTEDDEETEAEAA
jgi:WhiB family transcriptional regulator, redox-sensing transcriptional regulator